MGRYHRKNKKCDDRVKKVKANKVSTCKLKAHDACVKNLDAKNVEIRGVNLDDYLLASSPADFKILFDEVDPNPPADCNWGVNSRYPKKPENVNEEVFKCLCNTLNTEIYDGDNSLNQRLKAGRERLNNLYPGQYPQVGDVEVVGSMTFVPYYRVFGEATDPTLKEFINFYTKLGWNIELANSQFKDPIGDLLTMNALTTGSAGSSVLTVNKINHGLTVGTPIGLINADEFDGISSEDLNKSHTVVSVLDANRFTIDVSPSTANVGNVNGGGDEITLRNLTVIPGPRTASIYFQYAYVDKETGTCESKLYDLGNRQFQPSIDYDPTEDPNCVISWGEKYMGYQSFATDVVTTMYENMPNPEDGAAVQIVIIREPGLVVYFPGGCEDESRGSQTVITNPSCVSNCVGNASASQSISASATVTPKS